MALAAPGASKDAFGSSGERQRLTSGERAALRKASKPGTEVQMERRLGVPTILWAAEPDAEGGSPQRAARRHLKRLARRYRLSGGDVDSAEVASVHDTGRGAVIVTLRQEVDGVPVFREEANVLMTQDLGLVGVSGYLSPRKGAEADFSLGPREAVASAASDLSGKEVQPGTLGRRGRRGSYERFAGDALGDPARAKRVMYRLPDGLVPAYYVEVHVRRGDAHFGYVIAAADGRVLSRNDLVSHADFSYRVWADSAAPHFPMEGPQGNFSPNPAGTPDGSEPPYVAPPLVTLAHGPISTQDPWLPGGSTETLGNNADAYADLVAPDGLTPATADTRATVTAAGVFDRTYDTGAGPQANTSQTQAAVTNAFYTVNFLHDWFYDAGFDEGAGNAQDNNYGRGGLGADSMKVEAQDVSGRNNANMFTPADGGRPRMQMFLWNGRDRHSLTVNSPDTIDGQYGTGAASFGPANFETTGDLEVVNDGVGTTSDGCSAMSPLTGKIAVIDRGGTNCGFALKVKNAQDAGAIAALIVNVAAGSPPSMGGTDASITIPSLSLTLADGNTIKGAIAQGTVNATLRRTKEPDRDGAIDNQMVAHEWGHYLNRRLVDIGSQQSQGLGEGWSDFVALLMTARAGDDFAGVYPFSAYAFQGLLADSYYFGLRRFPYSTDFTKNALTFKHISDGQPLPTVPTAPNAQPNSERNNTGEVWATMLWESYAALLRETQGPNPRLTFEQARSRMRDYLVAAYKMTPSNPTLVEARDALLMAAAAGDERDVVAFWEAFARRGAGTGAVAPDRNSTDNSPVVESFETGASLEFVSAALEEETSCDSADGYVDKGERGRLRITVRNDGARTLNGTTAKITSANPKVKLEDDEISLPSTKPFQTAEASAFVSVESAPDVQELDFGITAQDPDVTGGAPVTGRLVTYGGANIARDSSPDDDVESRVSAWTPEKAVGQADWTRTTSPDPLNSLWHGPDAGNPTDTSLVSPPLNAGTGPVSFSFSHRYAFEADATTNWDGGVIELSTDGGQTWVDASTIAGDVGYAPDPLSNSTGNPLGGRRAYTGTSPGYPAFTPQTVNLGTSLAGQTFRVRFRIGSDNSVGNEGWDVDDLSFTGLTNTPFHRLVADAGCSEAATPIGSPGASPQSGQGVTGPGSGSQQTDTPPVVSAVALDDLRFRAADSGAAISAAAREGTRVRYRLSEAATVTVHYERRATGRRAGRRCRAPTRRNRKRRKCTRWVLVPGSAVHRGSAGSNSFRLTGRLRGRALKPGRYRLRLSAKDATGKVSTAGFSPTFRIVRR